MRIGIFTDTYKPQVNGVVTSICLMEYKLKENGHQPYIFTVTHPDVNPEKEPPNVFRIGSVRFWGNTEYRIAKLYSQTIINKVRELQIELIHSHDPFSLGIMGHIIATRLKLPEVHTYHTMLADYTHYVKFGSLLPKEAAENYSRVFCNQVDAVIVPTQKVYTALINYGVKKPIYIIPTGIDLQQFYQTIPPKILGNFKTKLGFSHQDRILIFVGRLAKEKGLETLIAYQKKLQELNPFYKLLIVGAGKYMGELNELVSRLFLENNIVFSGEIRYEDLPIFYQLADCFVTASTSETQGLVVLEAAASKKPIVAIFDESYFDIVKHDQNGFYYHTETEYLSAVKTIMNDKQLRLQMGTRSRKIAEGFSADNFYEKIISVYKKTLYDKN